MKRLAFAFAILLSSGAFAGEDSTHRAYNFGPAWYETGCELHEFNWYAETRAEALRCLKK